MKSSAKNSPLRWLRRVLSNGAEPPSAPRPGFFDRYPRFYNNSASHNRLNERYRALITPNESLIRGKTILDLASNNGRWTFAALSSGAKHIKGIEGRPHFVEAAVAAQHEYGIEPDRYDFLTGDIFDRIDSIPAGTIDTVFCFGFFYHTPHHVLLLSKIARLNPKNLILDTEIERTAECLVRFRKEQIARDANSITGLSADPSNALVGRPSRSALEMMLSGFRWNFSYYDWEAAGVGSWEGLKDYLERRRVTIVATQSTS